MTKSLSRWITGAKKAGMKRQRKSEARCSIQKRQGGAEARQKPALSADSTATGAMKGAIEERPARGQSVTRRGLRNAQPQG